MPDLPQLRLEPVRVGLHSKGGWTVIARNRLPTGDAAIRPEGSPRAERGGLFHPDKTDPHGAGAPQDDMGSCPRVITRSPALEATWQSDPKGRPERSVGVSLTLTKEILTAQERLRMTWAVVPASSRGAPPSRGDVVISPTLIKEILTAQERLRMTQGVAFASSRGAPLSRGDVVISLTLTKQILTAQERLRMTWAVVPASSRGAPPSRGDVVISPTLIKEILTAQERLRMTQGVAFASSRGAPLSW